MSLLAILIAALVSGARAGDACVAVPVYENGARAGQTCDGTREAGLTMLDLGDDWAPRIFSETSEMPQAYRETFVALANEELGQGERWEAARRDRYFELYGIFPSLSVIRGRIADEERHLCHASIDDSALRTLKRTLAAWEDSDAAPASAVRREAVAAVQRHLRCDGLLSARASEGSFDEPTRDALALYQRRHMIPSSAVIDAETRTVLLTPSRELDFRTLLRALRERVVDATGLIEDGSARNAWEPIFGRFVESSEYRRSMRAAPLENGAPDLVDRATEAAARALGWTSPEDAARALAFERSTRVAVRLPPVPGYHERTMQLRVEIDRGDVWTEYPLDARGNLRPSPVRNRPTLTLFAQTAGGDVALVRWPTTIGAWKDEKDEVGSETLRYKASPVGRAYWRDLVVAPAWFPPPTTPDRELVRRRADGALGADEEAVGPGYRSAYGLVALLHHRAVATSGGASEMDDLTIRTHGSGNYRSILRGSSHGCHRLFNHLAIRLGGFVLDHRAGLRHGLLEGRYSRRLWWKGRSFTLHAQSRGYRYELVPPIPVDVLPGRRVHSRPALPTPQRVSPVPPPTVVVPPSTPQS